MALPWNLSLWIFRLGTFVWDLSLDIIYYIPLGLGYFDWKLVLGIFRLGTFALGSLGLGNWSPEAGGTGWLTLGEPGRTGSPDRVFEILSKHPSSEPC